MATLLETFNLTVAYGGVRANEDIRIKVDEGELVGLIGPNGAGKTTFIDAITGFATISQGSVMFRGQDITHWGPHRRAQAGLVRTFQSVELFDDLSVMDNLLVAAEHASWWTFPRDLVRARPSADAVRDAEWALEIVGLERVTDRVSGDLSQGQRKLVGVARALAARPKLMLVDEPAAGLDTAESVEFGKRLRRVVDTGIAVLLIDHDMSLVLSTCDRLCVLDFGRLIADGGRDAVRTNPAVVAAYLGRTTGERRAQPEDAVAAPPAQTAGLEERAAEVRERTPPDAPAAATPPHDAVLTLKGLVTGYNGIPVVHGIDLHVGPREVVALLGPNGAGKTTTLITISGILKPLEGEVAVLGTPLARIAAHDVARRGVGHVAEDRSLFFDLTVHENLRLGLRNAGRREVGEGIDRAMHLFPPLQALRNRKAGQLSGGEQQMLAMARAMVSNPKILLVDELSLGLAPVMVERLLPVVRELADASGCSVLLVEQHVHMALDIADRGYVMSNGRIILSGSARDLLGRRDFLESSYLSEMQPIPEVLRGTEALH
jgi:branched-chain amino acid transport system ATP-binding protein